MADAWALAWADKEIYFYMQQQRIAGRLNNKSEQSSNPWLVSHSWHHDLYLSGCQSYMSVD